MRTCCQFAGCKGQGGLAHYRFMTWLKWRKTKQRIVRRYKEITGLNYSKIDDVEVDGIDTRDYPDFCDAFICSATYKGRDMTERELELLNDDRDFVYEAVQNHLY